MVKFKPDYKFQDVTKINPKIFKNKKLLIFDIDNTLFYPETEDIRDDIKEWFKKINQNYNCLILSNSNTIKQRAPQIRKLLHCKIHFSHLKKPSKTLFKEIEAEYKVEAKDIVMIGDLIFSDILFGNRNKATTILVQPLGNDNKFKVKIARYIQNIIWRN